MPDPPSPPTAAVSAGDPSVLKTAVPLRTESMEFSVPTRRKSLAPPTDDNRHPFLEGDAPAVRIPVKRKTPATAQMQSGMPEWRPSVRQMQPVSSNAAGMTDARRAQIAQREMGSQLAPVYGKPRDGREQLREHRGRQFTQRSHLLHVDRVPYGFDDREEKEPNSPRKDGNMRPRGRTPVRGNMTNYPYPFDDDNDDQNFKGVVDYETDDRAVRGFGLEEVDCFGRAPSPRRQQRNWQHASNFTFAGDGTDSPQKSSLHQEPNSRNLQRTTSIDARQQGEDQFRSLKAKGPTYAWDNRDAASADPNSLWGAQRRVGDDEVFSGKTKGRMLGPRSDPASIELELSRDRAQVVGVEWASEDPPPFVRSQKLGSPKVHAKTNEYHDPWAPNPESVGAIQLGAGVYAGRGGENVVASKFEDPRAADKKKHEAALYASTAARYDDSVLEELAANRTRCETGGAGRVLGYYLYEARGEELVGAADAAAARESQQRARPPSPGRRTRVDEKDSPPHYLGSNYY